MSHAFAERQRLQPEFQFLQHCMEWQNDGQNQNTGEFTLLSGCLKEKK